MDDTKPLIDAIERLVPHAIIGAPNEGDLALAVLPPGKTIQDLTPFLDALRDAPRRIETSAVATQIQSLIDYLNRFKLGDSAVFASDNPKSPSLLGVIDFHGGTAGVSQVAPSGTGIKADQTPGSLATPRFGRHSVRYSFPVSEQFSAWSGLAGKPLSHEEMATFLAERQYDICNPPLDWMQVDPATVALILHLLNIAEDQGEVDDTAPDEAPADDGEDRCIPRSALYKLRQIRFGSAHRLIQLARTVEISVNAKAVEGYVSKTGERTIQFEEEHDTRSQGRKVIVPDAFLLRIPVFEGETPQMVPVRLQYRRVGTGVKWFMTLVEWQRVIRFAVRTEAERVQKATELPLFYGARSTS